ncbi:MAG: MFS transporter [Bacteroidales bacterium]|nr:MFS transporter [Bacteroidales bacterium]
MALFSKHPKGLAVLFFSEMWERFCYYGMRGLLALYLANMLLKNEKDSFAIYAAYTALIYAAPVLGGRIADKILGYKYAVILGSILMSIGEFMILGGTDDWLFLGMGALVVGNGLFKANVSTIVGKLYKENDNRRDSGFTIFYIGINIGALMATIIVAEVGIKIGYHYGFALAGIGMLLGALIFFFGQKSFADKIAPPNPEKLHSKVFGPFTQFHMVTLAIVAAVPAVYLLVRFNQVVGVLLAATALFVIFTLIQAGIKGGKILLHRMFAFVILLIFNVVFWTCFEQAGTSLTFFADRNINRMIGNFEMAAPTTQFFNPFFIMIFGSLFSMMWIWLDKIKKNPNIPAKFGFGIIQLGLGYLMVQLGALFAHDYLMPILTLVFLYLLHTTGELFISPIGLSMVTKLAPKNLAGTMMGAWFMSWSAANYLAGSLAKLTGSAENAATRPISETYDIYLKVFTNTGLVAVGIGLLLLILSKPINKLMHGVK